MNVTVLLSGTLSSMYKRRKPKAIDKKVLIAAWINELDGREYGSLRERPRST